ncbi:MAG TPA: hypothetical protein VHA12_01550 [Candidatus Nanoarchaeia archaeon]|nr:hypothetical protein [Candidatus Nanoarchaeia archaeon]
MDTLHERFFVGSRLTVGNFLDDRVVIASDIKEGKGALVAACVNPESKEVVVEEIYDLKKEELGDEQDFYRLLHVASTPINPGTATYEIYRSALNNKAP